MTDLDLSQYGITDVTEVIHNPSYELLFEEETRPGLEGYEKGVLTNLGAVNVDTGIFTGRSPKDKYIVKEPNSQHNVWWAEEGKNSSDNKPLSPETWEYLKEISAKQLTGKKLYVVDAYAGANADTRLKVRFIMEVAWQ